MKKFNQFLCESADTLIYAFLNTNKDKWGKMVQAYEPALDKALKANVLGENEAIEFLRHFDEVFDYLNFIDDQYPSLETADFKDKTDEVLSHLKAIKSTIEGIRDEAIATELTNIHDTIKKQIDKVDGLLQGKEEGEAEAEPKSEPKQEEPAEDMITKIN